MMEIFDKGYKKIAILENVFNVREEIHQNGMSYLEFDIPADDPKNSFCKSFNFVKYNNRQVYRIMPKAVTISENNTINYECEHAIATLIDDVLFGYHVVGNRGYPTREVIEYILNKQKNIMWELDRCDFDRQFEYGWEQENLLSALFSVPKPITDEYIFTYNTDTFPFKISLEKIDMNQNPSINIRKKKNTLRITSQSDPKTLCTRLYPLGYGEGVNQLNIKNLNNGIPYIQSSPEIIAKYGIIERIWIDRRYENEESLFNAAKAMLGRLEKILVDYEVDFVDVDNFEKAEVGKIARVIDIENGIDFTTLIKSIKIEHSDITRSTISVSESGQSIASSVADLADRQRIETTYAQGATQLYAQSLQANADKVSGAVMNFFIPEEMRIINKVLIKVKLESFRSYSRATENGGGFYRSTEDGGGIHTTTEDGGALYMSTEDGGGSYPTSDFNNVTTETTDTTKITAGSVQIEDDYTNIGKHNHGLTLGVIRLATIDYNNQITGGVNFEPSGAHNHGEHKHSVRLPSHVHDIKIDPHNHKIETRDHRHAIEIGKHKHGLNIDDHDHYIVPGIYRFGNPQGFLLKINGKIIKRFNLTNEELDITEYLLNKNGNIDRGNWQYIEIIPDDLAYVSVDLMLQGFIQSRGNQTV